MTITATIEDVPGVTIVANQATHVYDADSNGTNETAVLICGAASRRLR